MSWFTASVALVGILAAGQPTGPKPEPPPFPDLSDPKAAAFSLVVALAQGDVTAARAAYVGNEELFLKYLDALGKTKGKADRVERAITGRFGKTAWTAFGRPFDAELQVRGEKDAKVPMSVAIAVAEVKQQGDEATLALAEGVELRLRKTKKGWRVTQFPGPSPFGFLTLEMADRFLDELATEVEQGKHRKVHEVVAAAQRIRARQAEELFKKGSSKQDGSKGDKK
jgi:hypothetical protein